jgi:hypothetical protein
MVDHVALRFRLRVANVFIWMKMKDGVVMAVTPLLAMV